MILMAYSKQRLDSMQCPQCQRWPAPAYRLLLVISSFSLFLQILDPLPLVSFTCNVIFRAGGRDVLIFCGPHALYKCWKVGSCIDGVSYSTLNSIPIAVSLLGDSKKGPVDALANGCDVTWSAMTSVSWDIRVGTKLSRLSNVTLTRHRVFNQGC